MPDSPYTAAKSRTVPRSVKQVVAGFVRNDKDRKNGADVSRMRRALRTGSDTLAANTPVSVVDGMKLYSQALKKQREMSKEMDLAKKKLKYSFKKISSRIISCKTSTAAREVVSQAKREIEKLKSARRTGKYDEEELEAALDHAKAMERIARKKVHHLEEEEMAKRCSSEQDNGGPAIDDEAPSDTKDPVKEEIDKLRDDLDEVEERSANGEYIESEEITNEMINEITGGMEEMLDAIEELSDLMDELVSNPVDMDQEDIKAMTIKHRNKEMKEITKADADYLKALFDHYDKIRSGGQIPTGMSQMDASLSGGIPEAGGAAPVSVQTIDVAL